MQVWKIWLITARIEFVAVCAGVRVGGGGSGDGGGDRDPGLRHGG